MTAVTSDAGAGATPAPAVHLDDITKRYGAVVACDHVDLELHRGEIHGILGENGAGKSTLMKILIGLVPRDDGRIFLDGHRAEIEDPLDAAEAGIGMVHQHFSLVEALTVWENVTLGEAGRFDPVGSRRRVREISEHYGLGVDPDARVADLPAGLRQRVEIIKCLRRNPDIIIFDEPTSVLTPAESERLFEVLRRAVSEENKAVALVSHKLDEILRATDRVTIMRTGKVVERMATADADAPTLARAMVGREVSLRSEGGALGVVTTTTQDDDVHDTAESVEMGRPVLEISGVVTVDREGVRKLDGLDIVVHPGEIVGVAGVEGNGQESLTNLLSSLETVEAGSVSVDGRPVEIGRAGAMARAGIAVIPADRHDSGCVLEMSVAENLVVVDPHRLARKGFFDPSTIRQRARDLIEEFQIQTSGPDAPFWSLSGGNQQRVILARELSNDPKVLLAAQPSRGLDVGAIEYMGEQLRQAAEDGVGVLLISSELEEIMDLADRIVVLSRGRIVGEMRRDQVDLERLGMLMGGVTEAEEAVT
ncbi:MAG: ABC transporter ATP-binding protein [Acidimicrobiales bacterium]